MGELLFFYCFSWRCCLNGVYLLIIFFIECNMFDVRLLPWFMVAVLMGGCATDPAYVPAAERVMDGQGSGQGGNQGNGQGSGEYDDNGQGGDDVNDNGDGDDGGDDRDDGAGEGDVVNGHSCVDLGLGVRWAVNNVDVYHPEGDLNQNVPGSLFKWGAVWPVSVSELPESCPLPDGGVDIAGTGYDAATALWGAPWRMPTEAEVEELVSVCEVEVSDGGFCFRSPVTGASVFLPAAGCCDFIPGSDVYTLLYPGDRGYYRTATSGSVLTFAVIPVGDSFTPLITRGVALYAACSIRPVCPL